MLSWIPLYISLSSKPMVALLNVLMPVVVNRLVLWNNGLMLEASFFGFFKCKCKGSVASLKFVLSNLSKSLFVAILDVGVASNLC